jgi:hypothetical protein
MEEVEELIRRYHLGEDPEHVIIPLPGGKGRRCFLLKRRFMRIVYPDGHFMDYPLTDIIKATLQYPDLPLSRSLEFVHREAEEQDKEITDNGKGVTA